MPVFTGSEPLALKARLPSASLLEAVELDHVPVRLRLPPEPRGQLLQDQRQVADDFHEGREGKAGVRCPGEAHHQRRVRPAAWIQFHWIQAERHDEIGQAEHRVVLVAACEGPEEKWMSLWKTTLGFRGREHRDRERLGEGAKPNGIFGAALKARDHDRPRSGADQFGGAIQGPSIRRGERRGHHAERSGR